VPNWKKLIVSGSDAMLNSVTTPQGTVNNISASYSLTSSYINPLIQDVLISGSLNVSGSVFLPSISQGSNETNIVVTDSSGSLKYRSNLSLQGATGTQGIIGTQGTTGAQGTNGTNGSQGATGTTGGNGAQGTTGTTGVTGGTGAQGTTGNAGTQGTTGTTGGTGAQGTIGTQGTTGIRGSSDWTPNFTNVTQSPTDSSTFTKTGGANAVWDSQVYSTQGYVRGVYASARISSTSGFAMFGLNSDPTTDAVYSSLDYAIYFANGTISIYESNTNPYTGGTYTTGDTAYVTYDGVTVRYYLNGTLLRSVARAIGSALYFDSSIYTSGLAFTNVSFGPMGEQGIQGTTGATGGTGAQGTTGATGETGVQGLQGITGASAGITSYTNPADNRVLTSVSSTTINAESNLTFDGTILSLTGSMGIGTASPRGKLDVTTVGTANDSIVFGSGTITYPTAPYGGYGGLVSKGLTSDARLMMQDGNGRINNYWNAYSDAGGYKYIVSSEPAAREQIHVNTNGFWSFYGAPSGTSGSAITFTQGAYIEPNSSVWFSPRGTSSDFYINNSGNVGIGTVAPTSKFHIEGDNSSTTDETVLTLRGNGENGKRIDFKNAFGSLARITGTKLAAGASADEGILTFETSTNSILSEKMRITDLGNVGIGTTAPSEKLELYSTGETALKITGLTNSTYRGIKIGDAGATRSSIMNRSDIGELKIESGYSGYGGFQTFYTNGAERMRIFSNGRVGIGTITDEGYLLDVNGTGRFVSNLIVANAGTTTIKLSNTGNTDWNISNSSFSLKFDQDGSEKMRISSITGNVGIGTTSPQSRLTISGGSLATSGLGLHFASELTNGRTGTYDAASVSSIHTFFDSRTVELTAGSTSGYVTGISATGLGASSFSGTLRFITSSAERMRIFSNGNVGIGITTNEGYKLDVNGTARFSNNVSIGTASNARTLVVYTTTNDVNLESTNSRTTGNNYALTGNSNGIGASLNMGGFFTASGATSNYGLRIYDVTAAASNYSLYSDSPAQSYFQGNVGIGTTAPSYKLTINSTINNGMSVINGSSVGQVFNDGNMHIEASDLLWINGNAAIVTNIGNGGGNTYINSGGGRVGIGTITPAASAVLDITSTTQGVLFPRLTTTQITNITSPANGLTVYNTTLSVLCFYDGTGWKRVSHSSM
jgi:hypothetical protein